MTEFSEKLRAAMKERNINQVQLAGLTGKCKATVSQWLSGKQTPTEDGQARIAQAMGLPEDYFWKEGSVIHLVKKAGTIEKLLPKDAARLLGISVKSVSIGLQQGMFPWGYGINTGRSWVYLINARRFAEIEGIDLGQKGESTNVST